jgi:hypothetical protein
MGEILMQMAWQLSDSGLIGLAQLSGESNGPRVRTVVLSMLRLLLITAGGVGLLVLVVNPSFVRLWVGDAKFGGHVLNALLVINVISISIVHGVFTTAAVLGKRIQIGIATFIQGLFCIGASVTLGHFYGLAGVAAASVLIALLVALPLGLRNLHQIADVGWDRVWGSVFIPWSVKALAPFVVGTTISLWMASRSSVLWLGLAPLVLVLYLWQMRPLFSELPVPIRMKPLLLRMKILSQAR